MKKGSPGRRAGRARALAGLALLWGLGCGGAEPSAPGPPVARLVPGLQPVTLGKETRLASGPRPRMVIRLPSKASAGPLPVRAKAPWPAVIAPRVVLSATAWQGENLRAARRAGSIEATRWSEVVSVKGAKLPLRKLTARAPEPPFELRVMALPVPTSPVRFDAEVEIPEGAVLAFGYALREESWEPGAPRVHFRARSRSPDGELRLLFERTLDPVDTEQQRWHEADIDLSEIEGRRVTLELEASWDGSPAALALPVFANPRVYVPNAAATKPNVLLVSIDTLRATHLGSLGYGRDTSPFIDSLADEGTLFERAMTTSVTTGPSHMSLFTGLYPVNHGLFTGEEWKKPEVVTLPMALRDAGYRTAAFTENGFIIRPKGFGEGFASYVENRKHPERPRDVRVTFDQARSWLASNDQEPFFVFVHTYEVHTPYAPPERYRELFVGDGHPGPERPDVRALRDDYDREIRYVDEEVQALFDTLREVGAAESTLVVVTSDHGEEFDEHGVLQHGSTVYEGALRVPILFWAPGRVPAGRRVDAPVSLIDVAPTLLAQLQIPAPPGLDGVDLSGLMRGAEALGSRRLFAEARSVLRQTGPKMLVRWTPPAVAVREGNQKFIVHRPPQGPREPTLAFDLAADPGELQPRTLDERERRAVEELVDRYLAGQRQAPAADDGEAEGFDPATEAQLRDLGYLE